jgi:hypothetical protein
MGFGAYKLLNHWGYLQTSQAELVVEPVSEPAADPVDTAETLEAPSSEIVVEDSLLSSTASIETTPPAPVIEAPLNSESITLQLDEQLIQLVEDEIQNARDTASTELVDSGWKVRIFTPNSALSAIGLRDGDFITEESIQSQVRSPERAHLARRLIAVLEQIRSD